MTRLKYFALGLVLAFLGAATVGGRIHLRNSTNTTENLAIGANNTVLKSNGTTASWGAITGANIANETITSANIDNGTIVNADVSASAAIAGSKIADGSIGATKLSASGTYNALRWVANGTGGGSDAVFRLAGDDNTGLYGDGSLIGITLNGTPRATFAQFNVSLSKPAGGVGSTGACWSSTDSGTHQIGECSSSRRYKENIVDLPPADAEKLHLLRPVRFKWKTGDKNEDYGFIAEEVYEHLPLLVDTSIDDEGGIQVEGVKYRYVTAVLVSEVQRLKRETDSLRARIEALEAK